MLVIALADWREARTRGPLTENQANLLMSRIDRALDSLIAREGQRVENGLGVLSVVAGFGFPELTAGNPSLQRLLSGAAFPIGLILVVILGAELFTGNNAVLMPAALHGKISPWAAVRNWVAVYLGNFMGALLFTMLFVYAVGLTAAEPYHSAVQRIAEAKVAMPWHVVLLKGIGAN